MYSWGFKMHWTAYSVWFEDRDKIRLDHVMLCYIKKGGIEDPCTMTVFIQLILKGSALWMKFNALLCGSLYDSHVDSQTMLLSGDICVPQWSLSCIIFVIMLTELPVSPSLNKCPFKWQCPVIEPITSYKLIPI